MIAEFQDEIENQNLTNMKQKYYMLDTASHSVTASRVTST